LFSVSAAKRLPHLCVCEAVKKLGGWPELSRSFLLCRVAFQTSLGRGFPEARSTRPERYHGRTLLPMAAGANMADAYVAGRCQGQDGREYNPGHELKQ